MTKDKLSHNELAALSHAYNQIIEGHEAIQTLEQLRFYFGTRNLYIVCNDSETPIHYRVLQTKTNQGFATGINSAEYQTESDAFIAAIEYLIENKHD